MSLYDSTRITKYNVLENVCFIYCFYRSLSLQILQWLKQKGSTRSVENTRRNEDNWAVTCDFQQCGILTSVDSYEPVQPPLKLRNSKLCSVGSLTIIEYSSDQQRLWPDCAYAQADLRLCWSHIPHCWKSHALAQLLPSKTIHLSLTNGGK